MADDLMDFSEHENKENSFLAEDENSNTQVPGLVNSPVIVNSILKQSTKDNLIQLYTPVQKPVKALNRKVRFGSDRLLETPNIKKQVKHESPQNTQPQTSAQVPVEVQEEDKETWIERTSILTKQDHAEYNQFAREFVEELVTSLPVRDDCDSSGTSADSGIEEGTVEVVDSVVSQPEEKVPSPSEEIVPSQSEASKLENSQLKQQDQSQASEPAPLESSDNLLKMIQDVDSFLNTLAGNTAAVSETSKTPEKVVEDPKIETNATVQNDTKTPEKTVEDLLLESEIVQAKTEIPEKSVPEEDKKCETVEAVPTVNIVNEAVNAVDPVNEAVEVAVETQNTEQTKAAEDSDEEFMSAGEEMEVDEPVTPVKRQEVVPTPEPFTDAMEEMEVDEEPVPMVATVTENFAQADEVFTDMASDSPARSPPKISYSLDFDNLDNMNPFASKASIMNSPDTTGAVSHVTSVPSKVNPPVEEPVDTGVIETRSEETNDSAEVDTKTEIEPVAQGNKLESNTVDHVKQKIESNDSGSGKQDSMEKCNAGVEDEASSPERIPPKVGYNLDFDHLDAMDPFANKKSLMNSPDVGSSTVASSKKEIPLKAGEDEDETKDNETPAALSVDDDKEDDKKRLECKSNDLVTDKVNSVNDLADVDPFKPTKQMVNSPDAKKPDLNTEHLAEDPFKPKQQIMNSPVISQETVKAPEQTEVIKSDNLLSNSTSDGPTSIQQTGNVDKAEVDPFKPKTQIMNTPDKKETLELNLMETDPFKPKNQMANSPALKNPGESLAAESVEEADPFKPRQQIVNSPAGCKPEVSTPCDEEPPIDVLEVEKKEHADDTNTDTFDEIDPFKAKKQMANSPIGKASDSSKEIPEKLDDIILDLGTENTDNLFDDIDPFKPKMQMTNSIVGKKAETLPENLDDIDPFKPKQQMANSPVGKKAETLPENLDDIDPLKPKQQMANSPVGKKTETLPENLDDIDPFKPKQQMANSPVGKKTEILPENHDDIDPFKPKQQMANSPVSKKAETLPEIFDDIDPFKPKQQMANSPVGKKTETLPENLNDIDPFKPKQQMANSPVGKKTETLPENLNDIDPFKPKQQMTNSPVGKKTETLPENLNDIDPFKPKQQMTNSPVGKKTETFPENLDDIDPFKPKQQMANSPVGKKAETLPEIFDDIDPFKPKQQMTNSPVGKKAETLPEIFDDIDPFKPKQQMANSPVGKKAETLPEIFDDIDPFKPKQQMANSPVGKKAEAKDAFKDLNPFETKTQLPNSPAMQKDISEDPFSTGSKVPNSPLSGTLAGEVGTVAEESSTTEGGEDEDIFEVQGVARRGEQPQGSKVCPFDDLGIDESQFVPASQVFNDPQAWDMLENCGSSATTTNKESSLSRMSLYVKFDPLVDEAPVSRRISIKPAQLEKVREYGLDDTLLLLGTPPKKRRQSLMSQSSLKMTPTFAKGTPTKQQVTAPSQEQIVTQSGLVDLMMACSPESGAQGKTKEVTTVQPVMSLIGDDEGAEEGLFQELKYTDGDLRRMKRSMQAELQGLLLGKEKEWYNKEQAWKKREGELKGEIREQQKEQKEFLMAFKMFDSTIQELSEKLKTEQEKNKTFEEQTKSAEKEISQLEKAFSDLHKRYEKARGIIETIHTNEDKMKKSLEQARESEKKCRKQAEEKISKYAAELSKVKQQQQEVEERKESQVKVLNLKLQNLQKNLDQKVEENKQLTELCEDMLSKSSQ